MNYQALKWMLESVVKTYKCPSCWSIISEENVDIVWAAWSTVNIDIECMNCWKHSMIKAEITQVDLSRVNFSSDKLPMIKETLQKIKSNLKTWNWSINTIKDEEIINLSKNLKTEDLKISDLFDLN